MSRGRAGSRVVRWVAMLITVMSVILAIAQTARFKDWLRSYIVRAANRQLNGTLSIGELRGDLLSGLELRRVKLSLNGRTVLAIDEVRLSYTLAALVRQGVVIEAMDLTRPVAAVRRDALGWDIGRLVRAGDSSQGPRRTILIRHLAINDGSLSIASTGQTATRLERIDAALSFQYQPDRYTFTIGRLSFSLPEAELALRRTTGTFAKEEDPLLRPRAARTPQTDCGSRSQGQELQGLVNRNADRSLDRSGFRTRRAPEKSCCDTRA
jgi:hypothetical protein